MLSIFKKPVFIILLVLVIDQALKIWVKTNMMLGEEFSVIGNWFIIHFIENNGMAFGMELAGEFGKIILSVFRIIAVIGIGYYLYQLGKKNAPTGLIVSISLVLAGALGNIIDSAFYGMIFNDSYPQVATMFPAEGGYSSFLHGKVVDMFYFPLINGTFPNWMPFFGGDDFVFFRPVFNVADSAITIGIASILIFQRKFFDK
ncbi:signal peptidase II [Saccharicrinis carchari]|uniref:Lipoprotein signal peptidase n=1 Tax=Saccharicrinis carchari TaxID=1168039 RepID=A0A521EVS4_SACCC|nr:lipoprotein signal peptidase [Saccharicrinis carchari]SMO88042.1 signal peptidase II [Saccharicrinis carchari]